MASFLLPSALMQSHARFMAAKPTAGDDLLPTPPSVLRSVLAVKTSVSVPRSVAPVAALRSGAAGDH